MNILFVGNFLSKSKGTFSVSRKVSVFLNKYGFSSKICSTFDNKFFRFLDIFFSSLFLNYKIMHIDVYSGMAFRIAEISSLIAKFRRKKIMLTLHGGMLPVFFEDNSKRIEKVFSEANHLQTPSLFLKSFFLEKGFEEIEYIPNPIDLSLFKFKRSSFKSKSVLWVRAFTDIYNPDFAVKVIHQLKKKYQDIHLTMVGPDKGLLSETIKLIEKLDLSSNITIVGPVKNEELFNYYHSHEVFINTTSFESFGVAVLEAAACGIPIVSNSVGEINYLWKNENDILLSDLNPINFSNQIIKLFNSNTLSFTISKNARIKSEKFMIDNVIHNWKKNIESLINKE
jgi:glycosyltransferase involved in cell wall biosynthesis